MKSGYVALVGRPNAGKSTLLNALVGTKLAIVSDKPQTTRTRILGVKTTPAAQIVFVDTPGVHRPLHRLNVRMVDAAVEAMKAVDLVVLVVDASEPTGRGTEFMLGLLKDLSGPVVLVLNKIDLVRKPDLLPLIEWFHTRHPFEEIVPISALTGDGADLLEAALVRHLPEGEPTFPEDYLTDQPERRIAAELVREQVLAATRDELPFSTAVVVEAFEEEPSTRPAAEGEEPERGLIRLACRILVERPSQKPILVGRRGEMVKRIGTAARLELERFFGCRVFLDLQVKVVPDWRENERVLDELGVEGGRPHRRARTSRRAGRNRDGSRS
ncbi:MAG TPA: GTPase Era [Vicinamibacterales bacterium]